MAGSSEKILMLVFMFACCVSILVGSLTGLFVYGDGTATTTTTTDDGSGGGTTKLDIDVTVSGDILPNGIECWYTGTSLDDTGLVWKDRSGKGNDIKDDNIKGSLNVGLDPVSGNYVFGSTEDGITIPFDFSGTAWTLFTVARYNGENKGRIFDAKGKNWLAGWHAGRTGLAYYDAKGWVTPQENVHGSGRTWIQTTAYKTQFFTNGDVRTTGYVGEEPGTITINMGDNATTESSDWAVHEIIVYGRALSQKDRKKVEKYLIDTYISSELQSGIDFTKGYETNVFNPPESSRTYSSVWGDQDPGVGHGRSMLYSQQAWSAKHNISDQWMEIDMGELKNLAGVIIQGRHDNNQKVTSFNVFVENDGVYREVLSALKYTESRDTPQSYTFNEPIVGRKVRFVVKSWHEHISMRAAVLLSDKVGPIDKNGLGGTAEKCRLYALKLGYKMWGHRTEKHDDAIKNVCFFYPNTDGVSYEGDTSDDKNVVGCAEKDAKLKDGCILPQEEEN